MRLFVKACTGWRTRCLGNSICLSFRSGATRAASPTKRCLPVVGDARRAIEIDERSGRARAPIDDHFVMMASIGQRLVYWYQEHRKGAKLGMIEQIGSLLQGYIRGTPEQQRETLHLIRGRPAGSEQVPDLNELQSAGACLM